MCRIVLIIFLSLAFLANAGAQTAPTSKMFDAGVLINDLKILSADDMGGRAPDTPGHDKALRFLLKRYGEIGLSSFEGTFEQKYDFVFPGRVTENHHGVNVVGYIKGSRRPDRYIVVSAHYDHLGIRDGKIFNGADDNASGSVGLLALASYFQKRRPENSMIFALMDSEEFSGAGGRRFVEDPPVPLRQIVMNVNIDMIGRDAKNNLYAVGTYHYPFLKPYLENVMPSSQVNLRFGYDVPDLKDTEDWTTQSDNFWFHLSKIPFISFEVEDFEQHHQPTDDFETITLPFFVHAVEAIVESTKAFDANLAAIATASPSRFPAGWPVLDNAGEKEVLATQIAFDNAVLDRDVQRISAILARELSMMTVDGRMTGRVDEITRLTDSKISFQTLTSEDVKVRMYGQAAVVTGLLKASGTKGGNGFMWRQRFTNTLVKRGVSWVIVARHVSDSPIESK